MRVLIGFAVVVLATGRAEGGVYGRIGAGRRPADEL
jgi:hypothetical protein